MKVSFLYKILPAQGNRIAKDAVDQVPCREHLRYAVSTADAHVSCDSISANIIIQ